MVKLRVSKRLFEESSVLGVEIHVLLQQPTIQLKFSMIGKDFTLQIDAFKPLF